MIAALWYLTSNKMFTREVQGADAAPRYYAGTFLEICAVANTEISYLFRLALFSARRLFCKNKPFRPSLIWWTSGYRANHRFLNENDYTLFPRCLLGGYLRLNNYRIVHTLAQRRLPQCVYRFAGIQSMWYRRSCLRNLEIQIGSSGSNNHIVS